MNFFRPQNIKIGLFILLLLTIVLGVRSYVVVDSSMAPTYRDGDRVITLRLPVFLTPRNAVVVFHNDVDKSLNADTLIKRIVAKTGDIVNIKSGKLFVNNSFVCDIDETDKAPFVIKSGETYVVGDNAAYSIDSRHFGSINNKFIHGVVILPIRGRKQLEGNHWLP